MARPLQPRACVTALLCALAGTLGLPALAQTAAEVQAERLRLLEQRLDASLKLIERLTERISELERAAAQAKPRTDGASPPAEPANAVTALRSDVEQLSTSLSQVVNHTGVALHGFADARAAWSSRNDPQRLRGFSVGTLDLYLTPQFGDRVKSLVEIVFEYNPSGEGEVEAERMQLGYTLNDALTLWGGRFHTPIGLWNTLYHHGANLQTSITRPRFIEFEDRDGLMPTHSVGLWGSGKSAFAGGKLTYDAYLANGPTIRNRTLDFNAFTDDDAGKMVGANIGYQGRGALHGLTLGVHGFGANVAARSSAGTLLARTRLRMLGGYASYEARGWEGLGEWYRFDNRDATSAQTHTSHAGYLQLGRNFGAATPYVRYERAALDGADNYFATQRLGHSYRRATLGTRFDLDARSALKTEFGDTTENAATLIDENGAAVALPRTRYRRLAVEYSISF